MKPNSASSIATSVPSPSEVKEPRAEARPQVRSRPTRRRWAMVAGGVPGLLLVGGLAAYGAFASWESGDLIAPGVSVAGEPVGGLTKSQAQENLERRFGRLFVTLVTPEREFKLSLAELGGAPMVADSVERAHAVGRSSHPVKNVWTVYETRATGTSIGLPVSWQRPTLATRLRSVKSAYAVAPTDARLRITDAGVTVDPEKSGRTLNVGETALNLQKRYYVGLPTLTATVLPVEPKVTRASLEGTDVRLAYYTTRFNPGDRGRTVNVRTAAEAVAKQVVAPGELFSFNACTGKRTAAKGYRMAHIFVREPGAEESEIVDGLAGGTCQVSTTLYNAVRVLNDKVPGAIKIVERNIHSLPVPYVRRGRDATVAWPNVDFRFRNDLKHPIYLRSEVSGSRLVMSVWGRVPRGDQSSASQTQDGTAETGAAVRSTADSSTADAGRDVVANPEPA